MIKQSWHPFLSLPVVLGALMAAISFGISAAQQAEPQNLDSFDVPDIWKGGVSEGAIVDIHLGGPKMNTNLFFTYKFPRAAGYAFAYRDLLLDLSQNFELVFDMKGAAPRSTFEVKFIDESGDNVWWRQFKNFDFSSDWNTIRIRRNDINFAWGPTNNRDIGRVTRMEIVVVGAAGESGTLEIDNLVYRALPEPPAVIPQISVHAYKPGSMKTIELGNAKLIADKNPFTVWEAQVDQADAVTLEFDLGFARDFGGMTLRWSKETQIPILTMSLSEDGVDWHPAQIQINQATPKNFLISYLRVQQGYGRYIRLVLQSKKPISMGLAEIIVEGLEFGSDDTVFQLIVAENAPYGTFPRGYMDEQVYWTIVGGPEGTNVALISEDGAVEPAAGSFSIEPFLLENNQLQGWAESTHKHFLEYGYLPIPTVRRTTGPFQLDIKSFTPVFPEDGIRRLVTRYHLTNSSTMRRKVRLLLAVRPMQVNPHTQKLNIKGGVSPIENIIWDGDGLLINDQWPVVSGTKPDEITFNIFDNGQLEERPIPFGVNEVKALATPNGFGRANLYYNFDLEPGETGEIVIFLPLTPVSPTLPTSAFHAHSVEVREQEAIREWKNTLNHTEISGPADAIEVVNSLRTALAHMLMTRSGAAIRPGARSYARSWIRDGAMIAESLLRLNHQQAAIDYANWFAPFQFDSGKIPCCVDARGADPVPENDSHGEFIFLVAEIYRHTRDQTFANKMWPYVSKASAMLNILRRSERTIKNQTEMRKAYFGLLPPTISHEGYSDKAAYSYWDDFWGLKGLKDAAFLAEALGKMDAAKQLRFEAAEFVSDIVNSIKTVAATHGFSYIPGAADRADFDSTSTTIALAPTGARADIPEYFLQNTFEKAWSEFKNRRDMQQKWDAYTPYEFRQVGAMLRLGQPARAHEMLDYYMNDRRPKAWNQWAEVVGREPREPRFIGDMPHTWVASDFSRSALDLFVYENLPDNTLIVASGLPANWLVGEGISVRNLMTAYGPINYSIHSLGNKIFFELDGQTMPPGGFVFPTKFLGPSFTAKINDKPAPIVDGSVRLTETPAHVLLTRTIPQTP